MAPIHDAARSGDVSSLAKVIDVTGVESIHQQHHQTHFTPLMFAASRNHVEVVRLLLEYGAVVDEVAKGYTALYLAAREGCTQVVALLLGRGRADPAIKTNVGWTTLMMAANRGHLAIVKMLLQHEAVDVNDTSNGGRTALWLACRWGHAAVAGALLHAGADFTLVTRDPDGYGGDKSPKEVAQEHGYQHVVQVIEDVEKAYLLHKTRRVHEHAVRRHRFPFLPPPSHLRDRVKADLPLPALHVTTLFPTTTTTHMLLPPQHSSSSSSSLLTAPLLPTPPPLLLDGEEEEEPPAVVAVLGYVAQHLHEELFKELVEGFFFLAGSESHNHHTSSSSSNDRMTTG